MVAERRKFTHSCSRCRASKLKCDRKVPCVECLKRNIGHLCCKDERHPRAKSTKPKQPKSLIEEAPDVEETAQALEDFIDDAARPYCFQPLGSRRKPCVAPDLANLYWDKIVRPSAEAEKQSLVQEIIHELPEADIACQLFEVFSTRCQAPLGNIFHTPSFVRDAESLYQYLSSGTMEEKAMLLSTMFTMEALSCFLLALILGLGFHPTPGVIGWTPTPLNLKVEDLRISGIQTAWKELAIRCLRGRMSIFGGSLASLQASLMLLIDGKDRSLELDSLLAGAISGAQKLGLHNLGELDLKRSGHIGDRVRSEVGIRIWWALVVRDWSRGYTSGHYSIHPSQFNTRAPLHINDEDLNEPCDVENHRVVERPRSEFTMLSYTRCVIEIAILARESTDIRNLQLQEIKMGEQKLTNMKKDLMKRYETFLHGIPEYFNITNTLGLADSGPLAAIPVHKWMLHQQIWNLFLRLHCENTSARGRSPCLLLAQNIINTYGQIKQRCTVCGSLSLGTKHLYDAAVLLLLNIIVREDSRSSEMEISLDKIVIRDKVKEATEHLKSQVHHDERKWNAKRSTQLSTERSILVLEALLKFEGDLGSRGGKGEIGKAGQSPKDLREKVDYILATLRSEEMLAEECEAGVSLNPSTSYTMLDINSSFGDLDVFPMVSGDAEVDFWQFMDFDVDGQS